MSLSLIAGQLEAKSGRRTGFVFSIVIVQAVNVHEDQGHCLMPMHTRQIKAPKK